MKRYVVERTNKGEIRPEEQNMKEWASSVGLCQKHKPQHPHHMEVSPWGAGDAERKKEREKERVNFIQRGK